MNKTDVSALYFGWLKKTIRDSRNYMVPLHNKLIKRLHSTKFLVQDPNDRPRENDGIDLRWRFAWECGHVGDELIYVPWLYEDEECSILEMMVALSFRADENFTKQNNDESTVANLFWNMVKNMGLLEQADNVYDDELVRYKLDIFNDRMYEPNGYGGLFMFKNCTDDMRDVEIWHQLCRWVNENYL